MNMSWADAMPAAAAAAATLFVAGIPACYALGLRGIAAWSAAPVVPAAVLGLAAMAAAELKIAWSPLVAAVAVTLVTALALAASWMFARRFGVPSKPEPPQVGIAAAAGLIIALLLGSVIVVRGLGAPDTLSWTWDTTFHYSALTQVVDSHNGSSSELGALGDPAATHRFYPAGWFDIASIVVMSTGASIPVAANATTVATAVLVWPLSCLFLARQIFGIAAAPLVITGGLAMAFGSYPWELFYWGALWPYSLGQALVPIGLGLVLSVTGMARSDAVGRGRAAVMLVFAVLGLGLAHPAALFGLGALAAFPVGWVLAGWAVRQYRAGRRARGVVSVVSVVAAVAVLFAGASSTSLIKDMKTAVWPRTNSSAGAVGEFLLNGNNGDSALWVLSAVIIVGAVVAYRRPDTRWLVVAHLGIGTLYVMAAGFQSPITMSLTVFWFNDSHRLAALLPTTGTALAVFGLLAVAGTVREWAERGSLSTKPLPQRVAAVAPVVLVALAVLGLTKGLYQGRHALTLNNLHKTSGELNVKLSFYNRIEHRIPDDAVVANNPEDASPLMWSLFGKKVLFPHIKGAGNPKQEFLAMHLQQVTQDPYVCQVARDLHVRYLLIDPVPEQRRNYPGLQDPGTAPGFELVETDGAMKLYRVTACGPDEGRTMTSYPAGR